MPQTIDIAITGYSVKADVYEGGNGPLVLSLIGRTSNRKKQHYQDFSERIANELGGTSLVFDYSGQGDSPLIFEELSPATHFLEVVKIYDWLNEHYPNQKVVVIGSSYGGFHAGLLPSYRIVDLLVLRAPAIYRPEDFYTAAKDENRDQTMAFRNDEKALADHPLMQEAAKFKGQTLVVTHENDHSIPPPTTEAYAKAFHAENVLAEKFPHSLNDVDPKQVDAYFDVIFEWIKENLRK